MKLEQIVTSLEVSRKIEKYLGKRESLFYWMKQHPQMDGVERYSLIHTPKPKAEMIPSFTAAELGDMLPDAITHLPHQSEKYISDLKIDKSNGEWCVCYINDHDFYAEYSPNEADARGKMLIYLIEKGILKTEGRREG